MLLLVLLSLQALLLVQLADLASGHGLLVQLADSHWCLAKIVDNSRARIKLCNGTGC